MRGLSVAVLAVACVVGSTPIVARNAGHGSRAHAHATTRLAPATPQAPRANPIPAPQGSPSPSSYNQRADHSLRFGV
jgi:hypothetical protein